MYLVDILLPLFLFAVFFKSKPTKNFYENNFSIENTNAIRGICAIWVVLHHISGTVDFVQSKVLFTGLAGQIPITVFFFLSGYAMTFQLDKKQDALNGFFKKRVLKIFMPLAVMAIVFFSYYRILVMQRANQISVGRQLLNSLIDLSHGYPLVLNSWFVVELILLYIIFYFSFKLTKKNKKRGLLVLFLSSGILMALLMGLFVLRGWPSTWFLSTLIFPLGSMYYIYKNFIDSYIKKRYWTLLIAAALLAAVISYLRRYVKLIPNYNISLLLDFAVCFAVGLLTAFLFVSATMKVNFSTPMWLYLGKNSYEIYLVHGFCIIILERIVYFQNASQDLLFGLAVLAFTLVLAPMLNYADKGLLKIFKVK